MVESRETTADVQKKSDKGPAAPSETANPSFPSETTVEHRGMHKQASPLASIDKRSKQRYANVLKARAGHRRNIRRSNTNG